MCSFKVTFRHGLLPNSAGEAAEGGSQASAQSAVAVQPEAGKSLKSTAKKSTES